MKKIFLLVLMFICSIALLTGCGSSPEGKWHCVKCTMGGEKYSNNDCKEDYGFGLSVYSEIEFDKDGEGVLTIRSSYKETEIEFEYEKKDDGYDIDFDSYCEYKKPSAKIEDGKLTLSMKLGDEKIVFTYEKGENEEEYVLGGGKQGLKTMNTNAKLVYVTVNGVISDLVADGKISQVESGSFGPMKISDLKNGPIQLAISIAMGDNGTEEGYVAWEIKNKKIVWAQWGNKKSGMIGQYPDPETDPKEEHDMGEKF